MLVPYALYFAALTLIVFAYCNQGARMTKAIFTVSESSEYRDAVDLYHFPKTYLRQVEAAKGDLVIFYQPRRNDGPRSAGGAQSYFAVARVTNVRPDPEASGLFYADLADRLDFDHLVPFKRGDFYYEALLRREDGETNRGAFGRSVRNLTDAEFALILKDGFNQELAEPGFRLEGAVDPEEEPLPEVVPRPLIQQVISRRFRNAAFRRQVREAYGNTCAVTGLSILDAAGKPEVQAAHVRAVSADGPDVVRNGIALTGTVHWLFDRGLISVTDEYTLMVSPDGLPDQLDAWLQPGRALALPDQLGLQPHRGYLAWHREHCFLG